MKSPRLFTATEAAALLGMTYAAFDSYVRRHGVPSVRVNGGHRRFTAEQIDAIKQARKERL